ncbi:hypothetical protein GTY80_31995 [Amycolatopsis sp. SID8362]|nr:hypothetical protein [Amycolatopsis sp. SID8362]NED44537.1 hypothetical protein [Amycolatopsis sp. SID8362]
MSSDEVNDPFMTSRVGGSAVLPDFAGALSPDVVKGAFMTSGPGIAAETTGRSRDFADPPGGGRRERTARVGTLRR